MRDERSRANTGKSAHPASLAHKRDVNRLGNETVARLHDGKEHKGSFRFEPLVFRNTRGACSEAFRHSWAALVFSVPAYHPRSVSSVFRVSSTASSSVDVDPAHDRNTCFGSAPDASSALLHHLKRPPS